MRKGTEVRACELRWHKGKLYVEVQAVIHIPIVFDAVTERWNETLKLTPRERGVLEGILNGLAHKEIANQLNIAARTVKFHASSLYRKFHVPNRTALAAHFSDKKVAPSTKSPQ